MNLDVSSECNTKLRRYKTLNGGVAYGPPPAAKEKKDKANPEKETAREPTDGPSKKELNKLKRKEKKAAYHAEHPSSEAEAVTEKSPHPDKATDDGGLCPELEGGEEGKVLVS